MSKPIEIWHLRCEALRRSKVAVSTKLKAEGRKLSAFSNAEINRSAKAWFNDHRAELIGRALGDLCLAKLLSDAHRAEARKSMASAVQKSSAKVEA
jgi:hypothetical protein